MAVHNFRIGHIYTTTITKKYFSLPLPASTQHSIEE